MKDEMPLTAEDFVAIRKSVLSAIEARDARRARAFRAIQFAFAAIVVVIGTLSLRRTEERRRPAGWSAAGPAAVVRAGEAAGVPAGEPPARPETPRRRHRAKPQHHRPVPPAATEEAPMRLELATADPDIRIIWISNPTETR